MGQYRVKKRETENPGVSVHAYNPITWEAKAGGAQV
jgi:hypothetical protein